MNTRIEDTGEGDKGKELFMKVYIMTKAKPFGEETYIGVRKSAKEAEKALREKFPYMRPTDGNVPGIKAFTSDKDSNYLLFIREEEI